MGKGIFTTPPKNILDLSDIILDLSGINKFDVLATNWIANSDTNTQGAYPYILTISSNKYSDTSVPMWDIIGTSTTGIPTTDEKDAIDLISLAYFNASGITLYATDRPSVNVVLRVKGD